MRFHLIIDCQFKLADQTLRNFIATALSKAMTEVLQTPNPNEIQVTVPGPNGEPIAAGVTITPA